MITSVNNLNAEEYRILFAKAMQDLMNHKEDGSSNNGDYHHTGFGDDEIKVISGGDFGIDSNPAYEKDTFFILDGEQFVLATDENADPTETYYQAPDISSLNAYFSYIEALAKIDEKYIVLPLTEDIFEINANTREITVPKHFKDNGISVQGDEISEILYFKIDRYFDAQDLDDPDMNIYIQWRSAAVDENKQPIEGVSQAFCVDVETTPNYIIFGWPISSVITEAAGEIAFAVRFYKFNSLTDHIEYSFSTLTQKVKIQPSLDLKIYDTLKHIDSNLILDDSTALVINRLVNSYYNDASVQAGEPYFIVNLNPFGAEITPDPLTGEVELEAWLDKDNNFSPFLAKVQANGDGKISYDWSYVSERNPNTNNSSTFVVPSTNVFYKTKDDVRWDGSSPDKPVKTYYTINPETDDISEDGPYYGAGTVYTGDVFDKEDENYPENGIWERFSEAQISSIGTYYVTVTNKVQTNRVRIESYRLVLKRPATPVITNQPSRQVALAKPDGVEEVSVTAVSDDMEKSKFTYQWQIQNFDSEEWNNVPADQEDLENDGKKATYTIKANNGNGLGFYRVIVTNNLNRLQNGEIAENSIESEVIRATYEASVPTCIGEVMDKTRNNGIPFSVIVGVDSEEVRTPEDSIEIAWYKYTGGTENDEFSVTEDKQRIAEGIYQIIEDSDELKQTSTTLEPIGAVEEGNMGSTYDPGEETGQFFCVVTNKYNGSQASRTFGMFSNV